MSYDQDAVNEKVKRMHYINDIKIGDIIAFRAYVSACDGTQKIISGMVRNISFNEHYSIDSMCVVTKNGTMFLVDTHDVFWVKNGPKWPKGIYAMLKGTKGAVEDVTK